MNKNLAILDTQIISYALKGSSEFDIYKNSISAITANEFLLVQNSVPTKANYYIPLIGNKHKVYGIKDHPFGKEVTDRVLINFASDFPTIIEFGSTAISKIINDKDRETFEIATEFLEKDKRKKVRRRFDFILEQEIYCIPLSEDILECGLGLLNKFILKRNIKKNFRNTLNDILILSTAISCSSELITEDKELQRFASEQFAGLSETVGKFLIIEFSINQEIKCLKKKENKGYINRGWQFSLK